MIPSHIFNSIGSLFKWRVNQSAECIAIENQSRDTLTYQEVYTQASEIVNNLKNTGVRSGDVVGVFIDSSVEWAVAFHATFMAGCVYLPIDPALPSERVGIMLSESNCKVVLKRKGTHFHSNIQRNVVVLDVEEAFDNVSSNFSMLSIKDETSNDHHTGDEEAYIMYTSGSTGTPKGIVLPHKGIINTCMYTAQFMELSEHDRLLQLSSINFDPSIVDILTAVVVGCVLVVAPKSAKMPGEPLMSLLTDLQVTTLAATPTTISLLQPAELPLLCNVMFGGEDVPGKLVARWLRGGVSCTPRERKVYNAYGPAENSVTTTIAKFTIQDIVNENVTVHLGKNIQNVNCFVLDGDLEDQGYNNHGELYIGGVGLALKYFDKIKTDERFVTYYDKTGEAHRVYRTGDIVFRLENGNLKFIRRLDLQVKIRGQRVELGEIENVLGQWGGLTGCVVDVVKDKKTLQDHIVAFVIPTRRRTVSAAGAIAHLRKYLPSVMIPSRVIPIEEIPYTLNGKVDRSKLKVSVQDEITSASTLEGLKKSVSSTQIARDIAQIWNESLNLNEDPEEGATTTVVGTFLELGGQSIKAAQISVAIAKMFGSERNGQKRCEVPLSFYFEEDATLERLVSLVNRQLTKNDDVAQKIERIEDKTIGFFPVSLGQEQILFVKELLPESSHFHESVTVKLGAVERVDLFRQAFVLLTERHEILRTLFVMDDTSESTLRPTNNTVKRQKILAHQDIDWQYTDLSNEDNNNKNNSNNSFVDEAEKEEAAKKIALARLLRTFNLEKDTLLRIDLIKFSSSDFRLYLSFHHIIADDATIYNVLLPEVALHYTNLLKKENGEEVNEEVNEEEEEEGEERDDVLKELRIQYSDYAVFDQERYKSESLNAKLAHWRNTLAGTPSLSLPTDYPRPATFKYNGAHVQVQLSNKLSHNIRTYCKREGVTPYVLLCTAWSILLSRYTNQTDFAIGTVMSSRFDKDLESVFGFFVDLVPLRINLQGDVSVRGMLDRVKSTLWDAYANKEVPLFRILKEIAYERDLSKNALFQAGFSIRYETHNPQFRKLGWSTMATEIHNKVTSYDLNLSLEDRLENIRGYLEYCTDLFKESTVTRMMENYEALLNSIVFDDSSNPISSLNVISPSEYSLLNSFNKNTELSVPEIETLCLHELFERQVGVRPESPAVHYKKDFLTYDQLDEKATKLAQHLASMGISNGHVIGLLLTRSFNTIIAMLAVLKTGALFVSLDPEHPAHRLQMIVEHSGLCVIITEEKFKNEKFTFMHRARYILVDTDRDEIEQHSGRGVINNNITQSALACILYTSGSTGTPKGVYLTHKGIVHYLIGFLHVISLKPGQKILASTTTTFDAGTAELFMAFVYGAVLEIGPNECASDPVLLSSLLTHEVSLMLTTPTRWKLLTETGWRPHKDMQVVTAGEALHMDLVQVLSSQDAKVYNAYGPTEASVGCTIGRVKPESSVITVGPASANCTLYILDEFQRVVPLGSYGEIYIGGKGVGLGYHNPENPSIQTTSFISWRDRIYSKIVDSSNNNNASRIELYKTGDFGRLLDNGELQCTGRINIDTQVKLHGVRVELGEVESCISLHEDVKQVVVKVHQERLVAFLLHKTVAGGCDYAAAAVQQVIAGLRAHVSERLPKTMWVSQYVFMDQFPHTISGKVDRKSFPEPPALSQLPTNALPSDQLKPIEILMSELWCKVLSIPSVGLHDNFFHLGGESISAIRLVKLINENFGHAKKITLKVVFEYPTIRQMLDLIFHDFKLENVDLRKEVWYDSELEQQLKRVKEHTKENGVANKVCGSVFLTGCTGFLGSFVLSNLLKDAKVQQIFCLVRSKDLQHGMQRIKETFESYLIDECNMEKIVVVPGDLSQSLFGLSLRDFQYLSTEVDSIIHNGAAVHFLKPYKELKLHNVDGTREVLRLASMNASAPIPVHYISTYAMFGTLGFIFNKEFVTEDEPLDGKEDYLFMGYTQTKWVAEKLIWNANKDFNLPVSVFRPALIMGHTVTGRASEKEAISMLVKSCIQVGCYAGAESEDKMFVPVDYVADAITTMAVHYPTSTWNGSAYHVCNPEPIYFNDFMDMVGKCGYDIEKVTFEKFAQAVIADGEKNELFSLLPLLVEPVYKEYTTPEIFQRNARNSASRLVDLLRDHNITCPVITTDIVKSWLTAWEQTNYFSKADNKLRKVGSTGQVC